MERLYRATGVTDDDIQRARAAMARQMRVEADDFIDDAVRRTMALPGYERLTFDQIRPNTRRSMLTILDTLEGGDFSLFGAQLHEVAYMRAKQGLPPSALYSLADITEATLCELAERCLPDTVGLLAASLVARRVADSSRAVVLEAFQLAHAEARAAVERLASQFSAPILPALPGVLVLPVVGAIPASRAAQIVDALLGGITHYAAHTAILDLTGITDVDASLPAHLERATGAARLIGARVVLVGIKPGVARAIVASHTDLVGVTIHATLAAALLAASSSASGRP